MALAFPGDSMGPLTEYRYGFAQRLRDPPRPGPGDEVPQAGLAGAVGSRLRDLIRQIWGGLDVPILKGHVSKDDVHLLVSIPRQVTISRLGHA